MRYISTRGQAPVLPFDDAVLAGLATDGGLYVPETWPTLSAADLRAMRGLSYAEIAKRVIRPFVGETVAPADLDRIIDETYGTFSHRAVVPMKELDQNLWLLELFHGPTLAFKDVALQFLGRLFDHLLAQRGERVTIVGATSGDTGSAAMEACRDRSAIDIFILFPEGRTSEVQRRQMTTIDAANVHALSLQGTFDDCQDMVKAMFNDADFRKRMNLSAVNSINWARVVAQIVYYVSSAVALGAPDRSVSFSVPTGNFGNVFAAYGAKRMGVPIDKLFVGTNRNDILARFFESGAMTMAAVEPSLSPSMDIQVSSNFERLLFDLYGRDGAAVADTLTRFRQEGTFSVSENALNSVRETFDGTRVSDEETLAVIKKLHEGTGEILDPHSAIAVETAERLRHLAGTSPVVALACAHPAKFPDAVERAVGLRPALPGRLADLLDRAERQTSLPNDLKTVQDHIEETLKR
ncbi:MAG: threonine synthase [Alphaproteobacteria bacterium]|nr:threonine synthase [Alphaproteobacteria bacterium]